MVEIKKLVLICHPWPLLRDGIHQVLEETLDDCDVQVVDDVRVLEKRAGLVLADPDTGEHIARRVPTLVIITPPVSRARLLALIPFVCGFILASDSPERIRTTVRQALQGQTSFTREQVMHVVEHAARYHHVDLARLTPRELDLARSVARGMSNREIARQYNLALSTVKNTITAILTKLELANRTQLAIWMLKRTQEV